MSSLGSTTAATPAFSSPIRYEAQPRSSWVTWRKSTAPMLPHRAGRPQAVQWCACCWCTTAWPLPRLIGPRSTGNAAAPATMIAVEIVSEAKAIGTTAASARPRALSATLLSDCSVVAIAFGYSVVVMCRNIRTLHNFDPPASCDEAHDAALQYVRKISGSTKPSKANEAVTAATTRLLDDLVTTAPPKNRESEAAKARARSAQRYAAA